MYAEDGALDDNVTINGSTTASDKYMNITAPSSDRHSGIWSDSKSRLITTAQDEIIYNQDHYTRISWLQLKYSATAADIDIISNYNDYVQIHHCIIDGANEADVAGMYLANMDNGEIYRNIIYDCPEGFSGACRIIGGGTNKIYNNTVIHCWGGFRTDNSDDVFINNAIFDSTYASADFYNTTGDNSSDYNCISDTVYPGDPASNTLTSKSSADNFVNTSDGSQDLRVKNTSADIYNAGSNLGSPYNIDLDGNTITGTWDIGADEYVTAAAPAEVGIPIIIIAQ